MIFSLKTFVEFKYSDLVLNMLNDIVLNNFNLDLS